MSVGLQMARDFMFDDDSMRAIVNIGDCVLQIEAADSNPLQGMFLYLPFEGSEKVCWDCDGERWLMLGMNLRGRIYVWTDICDPFDDTSMSAATVHKNLRHFSPEHQSGSHRSGMPA